VKNGAELLDRLVKDIVSESASTYVSTLHQDPDEAIDDKSIADSIDAPTAFSLARFIPLLTERIFVINPFTRTFLVSWITLLDSIPDLELVHYLPAFLGGLFRFLSDPNRDVHVATQGCLERFLAEIRRIARIRRGVEDVKKDRKEEKETQTASSLENHTNEKPDAPEGEPAEEQSGSHDTGESEGESDDEAVESSSDGDWVPGQDVHVDHPKILEILVTFLDSTSGMIPKAPTLICHTDSHVCTKRKRFN
jgi:vacuole morphology and inheritance protein 14